MKTYLLLLLLTGCATLVSMEGAAQTDSVSVRAEQIRNAARNGDARAFYQAGLLAENGVGERPNNKRAYDWYAKAAETGNDTAYLALGRMYENGIHVLKDLKESRKLYEKAGTKGISEGYYHAGRVSELDKQPIDDVIKYYLLAWSMGDIKESFIRLQMLPVKDYSDKNFVPYILYMAKANEAHYQFEAAKLYKTGNGISADPEKYKEMLELSAHAGYSKAQVEIGKAYLNGEKGFTKNPHAGVSNLLKAANQQEIEAVDILNTIDLRTYLNQDDLELLKFRASQKDVNSMYRLFEMYLAGLGGVQADIEKAMEYGERAAALNHVPALLQMAEIYEKGKKQIAPDQERAYVYYRRAARLNNDLAQYKLGERLLNNRVKSDSSEGIGWLLQAAEQNNQLAISTLGTIDVSKYIKADELLFVKYEANKGNPESTLLLAKYYYQLNNRPEAIRWLETAYTRSKPEAAFLMAQLYTDERFGIADASQSEKWLKTALADHRLPVAALELTRLYAKLAATNSPERADDAIAHAEKYLDLTKNEPNPIKDAEIYKIKSDMFQLQQKWDESILAYDQYLNNYRDEFDAPEQLIDALFKKSIACFELNKIAEAKHFLDISLDRLELNKEHKNIINQYNAIKGRIFFTQARLAEREGDKTNMCLLLFNAQILGIDIGAEYKEKCASNN